MPLDKGRSFGIGGRAVRGRAISLALLAAALGGCSSLPQAIGGLPEGAPARPAAQAEFPAVHDMPPRRQETLLEPEEQKKVQRDLERVRDQQASKARNAAAQK